MKEVCMQIDLHCKWQVNPPMYRLYVNDELFTERNFIWQADEFVTENLIIKAPAGEYTVKVETPSDFNFRLRNLRCTFGDAQVINNEVFRL